VANFVVASDRCKTVRRAFCGKHYLQEQHARIGPPHRRACRKLYCLSTTALPPKPLLEIAAATVPASGPDPRFSHFSKNKAPRPKCLTPQALKAATGSPTAPEAGTNSASIVRQWKSSWRQRGAGWGVQQRRGKLGHQRPTTFRRAGRGHRRIRVRTVRSKTLYPCFT
jgi:hypothetical protein